MAKKKERKKSPAAFFDYAEWCAVCVSTFFFKKKKQMDENIITLTISELTREFCFSLFFEKKKKMLLFYLVYFFYCTR